MLHDQIFTAFVGSYDACCDVIVIVNSHKAEVNAVKTVNCPEPNETIIH